MMKSLRSNLVLRVEAAAKREEDAKFLFLGNSFETIKKFTESHTVSHTPIDDNSENDLNANDWITKANKP